MGDLSFIEKRKLEDLFGMESGYCLDFSNRTFADFFVDVVSIDIWDGKYSRGSGSKANRMRAFWSVEPNYLVGRVISALLDYMIEPTDVAGQRKYDEGRQIAERLLAGAPVPELAAVEGLTGGREIEILAKSVKAAIENNEPEAGLDRLHTFTVKFVRLLCEKHGIAGTRDKPLHSLFGEYVKCLGQKRAIQSRMTEKILKTSISVLEAFNEVRNEQSLAHDNKILGYSESLLIFNHVTSSIRFLRALEEGLTMQGDFVHLPLDEEIPF